MSRNPRSKLIPCKYSSNEAPFFEENRLGSIKKQEKEIILPAFVVNKMLGTKTRAIKSIPKQIYPWNIKRVLNGKRLNTGLGIKIGIVDTGIDLKHPDLAKNIKGGINIVSPQKSPQDDNGHGTHIAGIIGAVNNDIGVVGIAPDVSLYAIKILDAHGVGSIFHLIKAIQWGINQGMNILNISISGGQLEIPILREVISLATKKGIIIVAAAGNSRTICLEKEDSVQIPARIKPVIAVASLKSDNQRSHYSAIGNSVDISAPGSKILSTYKNQQYALLSGTSMAAAHVTGVMAILRRVYPKSSVMLLRSILQKKAIDLPPKGIDQLTGAGLVQARV